MNYDKATWRSSGIYAIVNKVNGRRYIGATGRFMYRWTSHRLLLNKGKHPTRGLQQDWSAYGSDAFEFVILQVAGIMSLNQLETKYTNQCDNPYNTNYKRLAPDETA